MSGSTPYLEQGVEDRHASSDQVHTPAVCDIDVISSYQVTETQKVHNTNNLVWLLKHCINGAVNGGVIS